MLRAIDARAGRGPAVRRPRPALGHRLQRVGSAAGARSSWSGCRATKTRGLSEPTFRGDPADGAPGLPAGGVPAARRPSTPGCGCAGSRRGIVASALASVADLRSTSGGAGRDALLVRLSLGFVVVQSIVGLAANSTTVYLAAAGAGRGGVGLAVPRLGRRSAGRSPARSPAPWYPFPRWLRESRGLQARLRRSSRSSGARTSSPAAGLRLAVAAARRASRASCVVDFPDRHAGDAPAARLVDPLLDPRASAGPSSPALLDAVREDVSTLAGEHTFDSRHRPRRRPRC